MSSAGGASGPALTVEQYAGISAAVADGYPLDAVLAFEGLAPRAWPSADLAWKQRLVAEPATFASYSARLGEAEDWLGREVKPLDDDLPAWLGFLGAYAAHAAPFDLLGGLGLGLPDLGRLQRRWQKRLDADQELAKQAAELAKKKPSAVPKVSAAKGVLKPFPWSKHRDPNSAPALDLDLDAKGAGAAVEQPREEPSFAFAPHPDLVAPAPPPVFSAPLLEPLPAPRPAASPLAGTSLTVDVPRGPALPFSKGIAPKEIAEGAPDEPKPRRSSLGETALAVDVPRGAALPFAGEAKRAPSPLAGTSLAVDVPRGPALPFAAEAKPARAPSPLAGTSLAVDVPRGPALPFDPSARVAPSVALPSPPAPKAPRAPDNLGGTSLSVDVPRGPSLPFARPVPPAPPAPPAPAAQQRSLGEAHVGVEAPKPPKAPAGYAPALTLEQHASLTLELTLAPEKTAETLARYHLTPEARARLDVFYREKVAASPETRAAWERAYQSYHAWLAANRRPAR